MAGIFPWLKTQEPRKPSEELLELRSRRERVTLRLLELEAGVIRREPDRGQEPDQWQSGG